MRARLKQGGETHGAGSAHPPEHSWGVHRAGPVLCGLLPACGECSHSAEWQRDWCRGPVPSFALHFSVLVRNGDGRECDGTGPGAERTRAAGRRGLAALTMGAAAFSQHGAVYSESRYPQGLLSLLFQKKLVRIVFGQLRGFLTSPELQTAHCHPQDCPRVPISCPRCVAFF